MPPISAIRDRSSVIRPLSSVLRSMPKVTLRPTIAADLAHVIGEPLPYRIRAITAFIDDRVIGVGGIAFSCSFRLRQDGTPLAMVSAPQRACRKPGVIRSHFTAPA
jgi:hypothetical protein